MRASGRERELEQMLRCSPWQTRALPRTDTFSGREQLMTAIIARSAVGKPVGIPLAPALAVATR
jgi:hypothetical protein